MSETNFQGNLGERFKIKGGSPRYCKTGNFKFRIDTDYGYGEQTFHRPMINCCISYQGNSVDTYPFPECDIFCHVVSFHLAFHFNIEDL